MHQGKKNPKFFWVPAIAPLISVILSTLFVFLIRADKHGVAIVSIYIIYISILPSWCWIWQIVTVVIWLNACLVELLFGKYLLSLQKHSQKITRKIAFSPQNMLVKKYTECCKTETVLVAAVVKLFCLLMCEGKTYRQRAQSFICQGNLFYWWLPWERFQNWHRGWHDSIDCKQTLTLLSSMNAGYFYVLLWTITFRLSGSHSNWKNICFYEGLSTGWKQRNGGIRSYECCWFNDFLLCSNR